MVIQIMIRRLVLVLFFSLKAYIIVKLKIDLPTVLLVNMTFIAVIDLVYKIIPNLILFSMSLDFIMAIKTINVKEHIYLFILILMVLLAIHLLNKDIFYGGDIKLIGISTLYLGSEVIKVFTFTGIFNLIFHLAFGKKEIPLGPSILLSIILLWSG